MGGKTTVYLSNLLRSCTDKKTHLAGKVLHAHILRFDLSADTFLSNRLIDFYFACNNVNSAYHVFDKMPNKDVYSWNAILSAHCRAGNLQKAHELFREMPERNTFSWSCVISSLVRSGYEVKALDFYDTMISEGLLPTNFTLASILSACGALLDAERGRKCHGLAIKIGLDKNLYVGNALVCVYAKCSCIRDAVQVFWDMPEINEVTFTTIMGGLAQAERVLEAMEMFKLMCKKGIPVDSVSLSSFLSVYARRGYHKCPFHDDQSAGVLAILHGQQIHGLTVKLGFERDTHLSNSLLDMYTKNGDMDSAELLFNDLPELSIVSWNVMIAGYGQKYQSDKAMECLKKMLYCGFDPNQITYINVLAACLKSGDIEAGRRIFDNMSSPTVSSWNAILSGYSQSENHEEALKLFRQMQFLNVQPDQTTLAIILSSCSEMRFLEAGKQVHAASLRAAFHTDPYVASGVIGLYSKCEKIDMAEWVFYNVPELDVVCWNSMIAGFSLNSLEKEAFLLFKQMQQNNVLPSQFSYATILSCSAKLSSSFQGRQVHSQIAKDGYVNDIFVGSALVNMYCKCGDVDGARQFFDMMPAKNTVTWNEIIHGYAQNGCGYEAIHLYKCMIESGENPDVITITAVLTACSLSGLVDVGVEILNSMQRIHGLEPELAHYICVIDLLGRAGRLCEAQSLVETMPCKDDPIIWEVLLSSCRVHANVSLAKRAAEELFHLDPQNSVPYVLLANIYASLGRWDEAGAVREQMVNKQVFKDPGFSWIEDKSRMPAFMVDDNLRMFDDEVHIIHG